MKNASDGSGNYVWQLTALYLKLLIVIFALVPLVAILYIQAFQEPNLVFRNHLFHELAISLAIILSAFVTYITWRCYTDSGEVLLRWLTLGFLGFTLVYIPHGLFTRMSDENQALFLAFGPVSRLVMAVCFLIGLYYYGSPMDPPESRYRRDKWLIPLSIFLFIDLVLIVVCRTPLPWYHSMLRIVEITALVLLLVGIVVMLLRRIHMPLMTIYMISLAAFAQSSIAFLLASPWNHQWWLAHGIFAAGFLILSYGVVQAFRTTRSFATVYSQEQVMQQLKEEQARTLDAFKQLEEANEQLSNQVITDLLTGALNRRGFFQRAEIETARAIRSNAPLSLLSLDLDHFKRINDVYGHPVGDEVLRQTVLEIQDDLRPQDLLARAGGEEFWILLPDTNLEQAAAVAERVRIALSTLEIAVEHDILRVTVSVGCVQLLRDGDEIDTLIGICDKRLYEAKLGGRNRVVSGEQE